MIRTTRSSRERAARQRGASVVEYTLVIGIVATVGVAIIRTVGSLLAGDSDPCKPGVFVKAAQILGEHSARELKCHQTQGQ